MSHPPPSYPPPGQGPHAYPGQAPEQGRREKRPRARWYLLPVVILVASLALVAVAGYGVVRGLLDYEITEFDSADGTTIPAQTEDVAIWISPADASTNCSFTDDDGTALAPEDTSASVSITKGGRDWGRAAVLDASNGVVAECRTVETTLGWGDAPDLQGGAFAVGVSVLGSVLGVIVSIVLFIVLAVKRGRSVRRT